MLWLTAWRQAPCGSLPSEDQVIAALIGASPKTWTKLRPVLMRGWSLCSDGRLYHATVSARVLEMLEYRRKNAERVAKFKAAKREQHEGNALPASEHQAKNDTGTGTGTGTKYQIPKQSAGESVPAATVSPPEVENVVFAHQPTAAGLLCKAIKAAGVADVNPGHPDLLRLMAAKIPEETFTAAAASLAGRGRGRFALLLRTVEGQWTDAQEAGPVAEAKAADPWATRGGVEGIAKKLGMPRWDECCTFDVYLGRVRKAFEDEQRGSA